MFSRTSFKIHPSGRRASDDAAQIDIALHRVTGKATIAGITDASDQNRARFVMITTQGEVAENLPLRGLKPYPCICPGGNSEFYRSLKRGAVHGLPPMDLAEHGNHRAVYDRCMHAAGARYRDRAIHNICGHFSRHRFHTDDAVHDVRGKIGPYRNFNGEIHFRQFTDPGTRRIYDPYHDPRIGVLSLDPDPIEITAVAVFGGPNPRLASVGSAHLNISTQTENSDRLIFIKMSAPLESISGIFFDTHRPHAR